MKVHNELNLGDQNSVLRVKGFLFHGFCFLWLFCGVFFGLELGFF